MNRYVGHLAVMLHGVGDITESGDSYEVRVNQTANSLMPAVFTVGDGNTDQEPSDEVKMMFLLGVIREWHRKIEDLVRTRCKNLKVSDAVDLGDGQTGLVGDGGAKA